MHLPWRKSSREEKVEMRPSTLGKAREAVQAQERNLERSRANTPTIDKLVRRLKTYQEQNHFSEKLTEILRKDGGETHGSSRI